MHIEILTGDQIKLLSIVKTFSKKFGLVGGTAIGLHLGHRESIDFDLFSYDAFNNSAIKAKIIQQVPISQILVNRAGEFTFLIKGVKFTFFQFPHRIHFSESFDRIIQLPNILTLAAMKAYALGQRAKWKDYVDLYFILKAHHTVGEITAHGKTLFSDEFNEKIFRTQLAYFQDMNYAEQVIFKPGFAVDDEIIKQALIEFSLES